MNVNYIDRPIAHTFNPPCLSLMTQQPDDQDQAGHRHLQPHDASLSEESSGGWASEESEEDFIQTAPSDNGTSIAGWSISQSELYLTSQPSQQSMV